MLRRLLQVRPGESARTLLLFTYLFLIIATSVVTKAARDPIFQEKFTSAGLPYVDMASALCVAAAMSIYLRISRRVGLPSVVIGTLLASASATLGFWFMARVREPLWMLPVFYVWASVSSALLPAQVWTLANRVMTTREAKRLFGIVSAGAISGWIAGGLVTRAIATRLGTADLLLPTAAVLALCPVLVLALWRRRNPDSPVRADGRPHQRRHDDAGIGESFALIWKSPQLRAIAALIGVSSLVTAVVGWQFKAIAKLAIPHTDQLAAFYGTFNIYAGLLALITQFVIASRLLRRFGVGVALLVVPVALMTGSIGLLFSGSLWAAILLRGSDQVVRYSIDKPAVELLYLPIPAGQMSRAKALIDTVVWRLGDGVGAVLVLACISVVGFTPSEISLVILVLLVAWMAAAVAATHHYAQGLRASIYEHRLDAERLAEQIPDRQTADALAQTLDTGDPDEILYALTLLETRDPPMTHAALGHLLGHASPAVRRKAVALLAAANDATMVAQVEPLLSDEDRGVRAEALVYLARCGNVDPLSQLTSFDDVHGSAVASAVAHFLARPGPTQNLEAVRVLLEAATTTEGADWHHARREAARLIGSLPDQFEQQLNALLKDRSPDVARLALRAAGAVGKAASAPLVVERLGDSDVATEAADALVIFGDRALPALRQALADNETAMAVRHGIPDVLQRISTPEAEQLLIEYLLDGDPVFRLRSVSALNKLRQHGNRALEQELVETVLSAEILGHYRSYQLLGRLSDGDAASGPLRARVKASMDRELERIFRLMKLLLPQHDLHSAYVGLESGNAVVHANSLEFLEHALPPGLRAMLLPLIDSEVSVAARIAIAERVVGMTKETPEQALAAFAASGELGS